MLKMGCSMKEVADWLGHADIKTAMNVYAHLDFEMKQSVANRFGEKFSLKSVTQSVTQTAVPSV